MIDIFVYSRHEIQNIVALAQPHLIVSINCPDEGPAQIRQNRAQLGRANLFFWDLDTLPNPDDVVFTGKGMMKGSDIKEEHLIKRSDAQAIVDLVDTHKDEVKVILVHCTAGISRSSGVAAALHKVLNGSDAPIFGNRRYRPNMRVYRMVLEEWYSRHPQE